MIPMLDLRKEFLDIEDEVAASVIEVLKSTRYILGPHVEAFEAQLAKYHGLGFGAGVGSGTGALFLSLASLPISAGDEVITTPFTFFATAESILYVGAKPVFVDIDPVTLNMDIDLIEEKITEKTKAILPVHLFGLPCDMKRIMALAKKYNLHVVEDCAQSFGSSIDGKLTGTFGSAGCFSFYPSKNLGCYGDGGAVVTDDRQMYENILALRNHGSRGNYIHDVVGFNSRLDEIQAAILLIKLKKVEHYNAIRRENAAIYTSLLSGAVVCPHIPDGYTSNYHQYTIRSAHRDKIKDALAASDISSVVYYPLPIHLQKPLEQFGFKRGNFPVAEAASKEVLSLPVYPGLPKEEIERIAEIIKRCL
ncbi:MAG: DegT/DnrJ/EryC1/StrS family aminotransferase [Candidatus Magnetominusculus sp. LBB02]|nr:DegT/DnrJ/EryC1/StrS family aminotransferase [Candidatus Magnetominusculus sp. LBB02]